MAAKTLRVKLTQVHVHYICECCGNQTTIDLTFYQHNGTPVCPDCDDDMIPEDFVTVTP